MNSKERVYRRLAGKAVDKIPNLNITMLFAAGYCNVPYQEFCSDYRRLAECQVKTAEDFGIDILSTMSDPYREAYDFGADIRYQADDLPICKGVFLKTPEDIGKLKRWDPYQSTRMLDRIRAVESLSRQYGAEYPILGWIEGAMAEFCDLTGMSQGLIQLYEEPEFVKECLDIIAEQELACAEAQIAAGADIIGIGEACASLVNSPLYREFILPQEKYLIRHIQAKGAKVKLHICGDITHLLSDIMETGPDIFDIDYMVDIDEAVKVTKGKCSLNGNINPVDVVLQGDQAQIEAAMRHYIAKTDASSMMSAGCEIPKMTPVENLRCMDEVLAKNI